MKYCDIDNNSCNFDKNYQYSSFVQIFLVFIVAISTFAMRKMFNIVWAIYSQSAVFSVEYFSFVI